MALVIRMRKVSSTSKGRYNFRIIITENTNPRDSRSQEEIGYYDPAKKPAVISINKERYDYWVSKGAKPSDTVASLYKKVNK